MRGRKESMGKIVAAQEMKKTGSGSHNGTREYKIE
jgi:hypothetical protein